MRKRKRNLICSKGQGMLRFVHLVLFIAFGLIQTLSASILAQSTVTAKFNGTTLNDVIWELQRQTDFTFIYSTGDINDVKVDNVSAVNEEVHKVLDKCLKNTNLTYSIHNGVVAIKKVAKEVAVAAPQQVSKMEVKGQIFDNDKEALPGVNIIVKGTTHGTTTDINGNFTLDVEAGKKQILVCSFIGYDTQEVTAKPNMIIVLKPENNVLEEVVVTGYGTYKKSAYAGSASTIRTSNIKDVPAVSFSQVLQGAAPGVQVSAGSGQPGASTSIMIRGMGSFNASNSPLYVIDGVPVMSGDVSATGSDAGMDIMSTINTSDIENITVIKDAAAASLYGSRAANGVVLITTKQGKKGKPSFKLKADWGYSDFAMDYREVMNGQERRDLIYEGLKNGKLRDGKSEADAIAYADTKIDKYAPIPWCGFIDWNDVLFKKGSHQTYEVSGSGGTDKFSYYSSLSYLKQDGISLNSGLERISGRLNVDFHATSKLTLGAKILFASVNQDVDQEGLTYTSPLYSSRNGLVPSDPIYNEDGTWNRELIKNGDRNPLLAATYDYERSNLTRTFNTIYGQYEFIKGLKLKSTLSYDYTINKGKKWWDPRTSSGDDVNGEMFKRYYEYKKLVWENALSYQTTIAKHHHLDVLVGYETDDYYKDYLTGSASNFATYEKNDLSNGNKLEGTSGYSSETRLVSYLSRVNYDYQNKYFLGASFRTDGSSRLKASNRWGSFWSVSAAWRAIEEKFMEPVKDVVTDLKLRASYGVNGTLPSEYYGYMGLSSLSEDYMQQPGIVESQLRNDDLSWETNYNFNLGLDFGLWNRLNVTIEYYTRTTKNLLMDRPISMTTGFNDYLMNIGKVRNKGVELEIRSVNFDTKDFTWSTTFNLGHNKNKIITLDGIQTEIISGTQIRKIGYPYRTFYLPEFAGINKETGAPQFYTNYLDENGNYVKDITETPNSSDPKKKANYIPICDADPTVSGGLSNTLRYKWFDLNFMISYQFGGYSYDTWAQKTEHGGNEMKVNIPTYYRDRWQKPGDETDIEIFIENPAQSMQSFANSRRIHSTDFIRLKNLTFGFTLPKQWTRKVKMDNVRLYMSGDNLLTWAKYDYYDPEAVSKGTATWGTPPLKAITFGLNINF